MERKIHLIDQTRLAADGHAAVALEIASTGPVFVLGREGDSYKWLPCSLSGAAARVPIMRFTPQDPKYALLFVAEQMLAAGSVVPRYKAIRELHIVASEKDPIGEYMGLLLVLEP